MTVEGARNGKKTEIIKYNLKIFKMHKLLLGSFVSELCLYLQIVKLVP